jgi:hypothetical protein
LWHIAAAKSSRGDQVGTIFVIAFLFGGMLGLRFRFLILVPTCLAASLIIAAIGAVQHDPPLAVGFCVVSGAIGLQVGYLASAFAWTTAGSQRLVERQAQSEIAPHVLSQEIAGAGDIAVLKMAKHRRRA